MGVWQGGDGVEAVSPDDGGGVAFAREFGLPGEGFFREFQGEAVVLAAAIHAWPTPLRPVFRMKRGGKE